MHRESEVERVTYRRTVLDLCQTAPVVMIRKDDLHRLLLDRRCDVLETHDAHVRREWHRDLARDFGHAVESRGRVFQVFQDAIEFATHLDRGRDTPGSIGVESQWHVGEGIAKRMDGGDLLSGARTPPLSLMARNPYSEIMVLAWSTMRVRVERFTVVGRAPRRDARPTCRRGTPNTARSFAPHRRASPTPGARATSLGCPAPPLRMRRRHAERCRSADLPVSPWRRADHTAQRRRGSREHLVRGEHVESDQRVADAVADARDGQLSP